MPKESLYDLSLRYRQKSHSKNAFNEICWIITHILKCTIADMQIKFLEDFDTVSIQQLDTALDQFIQGVPYAYIVKSAPFYQLEIFVDKRVLIPRMDSECLVDAVLNAAEKGSRILELGFGSGAISCAIAKNTIDTEIVAIDNSEACMQVATKNLEYHDILDRVQLIQANWYDPLNIDPVDILVTNPPYIATTDLQVCLQVRNHEPSEALFSAEDGMSDIKHIIHLGSRIIKKGGLIVIEHGATQQDSVLSLLSLAGYKQYAGGSYNGLPRYVTARWP